MDSVNIFVKAEKSSNISRAESTALGNLYDHVDCNAVLQISVNFYDRVYDDNERMSDGLLLRDAFSSVCKSDAIRHQQEYLIEIIGGPKHYSERRNRKGLIGRHAPYPVSIPSINRWLFHMDHALNSIAMLDSETKLKFMNHFKYQAFFILHGRELVNQNTFNGYDSSYK